METLRLGTFFWLQYTSEADFNKPGIHGESVRVLVTARDVFRRAASSWSRWPDSCGFRGVFWVGWIFDEATLHDEAVFLPLGKNNSS